MTGESTEKIISLRFFYLFSQNNVSSSVNSITFTVGQERRNFLLKKGVQPRFKFPSRSNLRRRKLDFFIVSDNTVFLANFTVALPGGFVNK